jgi:hypothetical protein
VCLYVPTLPLFTGSRKGLSRNEVELSAVNGYTRVVQGFQGIGFVMNIVTVDSATCIDISIVSFLNE